MMMWYLLALLGLAHAEFTINVSSLNDTFALEFPSHNNLTVANIHASLPEGSKTIALCRPVQRHFFSIDASTELELDERHPLDKQGITWSWLSPRSITLNQNYVVVRELWTERVVTVTACRASKIGQVFGRVPLEGWFPKDTKLQPVEGATGLDGFVGENEVRPVGYEPDKEIREIVAKPDFSDVPKEHLWMAVGWIKSVSVSADKKTATVDVNEKPTAALFAPIPDDPTAEFVKVANVNPPNAFPVIGAIPNKPRKPEDVKVKRVDALFGILHDGEKTYEMAIPKGLVGPDAISAYIKAVLAVDVITLGDFHEKLNVSMKPTIVAKINVTVTAPPTTPPTEPPSQLEALYQRYKLRWNSSQPETKAVVLATIMFVVAAITAVIYIVWSGAVEVDDPVLQDVERDLQATERIQFRYT